MSEATLKDRVVYRLKRDGWKVAHAGRAWVGDHETGHWITPMLPGWPDLTCMKAGHRVIFIELKKELGTFEPGQVELLQLLNQTGNAAIVVRPSDLREGRVDRITRTGAPLAA